MFFKWIWHWKIVRVVMMITLIKLKWLQWSYITEWSLTITVARWQWGEQTVAMTGIVPHKCACLCMLKCFPLECLPCSQIVNLKKCNHSNMNFAHLKFLSELSLPSWRCVKTLASTVILKMIAWRQVKPLCPASSLPVQPHSTAWDGPPRF